ncbi:MAG TPA: rhamnogalacturonan acetylesterase [Humisphaera sp.]
MTVTPKSAAAATLAVITAAVGAWPSLPAVAAPVDPPTSRPAEPQPVRAFAFGGGPTPAGYVRVAPAAAYDAGTGFGFEPGANVTATDKGGDKDPVTSGGSCSSDAPFFFSAVVPAEGNYRVTVTLGGPAAAVTTVKAELRRLMLEQVRTAAGEFATRSFVVNVRTPQIAGGGRVKLKAPRETTDEAWAWDDRITLEFNGSRPSVCAVRIERVDVPTVYVLGDSTVCDQSKEPYASWGQMLPRMFKPDVAVANHAESGETLGSSTGARRLDKVLSLLRPGDFVLVQYGHNDMKSKDPNAVQTYKAALKDWTRKIKARGGTPVLVTPMNRHRFDGPTVVNTLGEYPDMVRQAAAEEGVKFIDLHAMSKTLYEALGPKESVRLFKHNADLTEFDGTHHGPYGAYELAKCVAEGLRRNVPELGKHLADDVAPFDPAKPDPADRFVIPPSPGVTNRRPLGD